MANLKGVDDRSEATKLVRTSILVPEETDQALRELAEAGERPLSWEIRRALEDHVERQHAAEPSPEPEREAA